MIHLLVLATVLSVSVADKEAAATASPQLYYSQNDYHRTEAEHLRHGLERLRHDLNIPSTPHRDMENHRYRQEKGPHHNDYARHGDQYEKRRDEYVWENKGHDRDNDEWQSHSKKPDKQWWTDKDYIKHVDDDEDIKGPVILRTIKSHENRHKPDIARQNKIIEDVYSPDYAEPTWIIDYRYLKTGGRDYTRGPGGQILILPKGIRTNEHKEFKNYDELIEKLKQENLERRSKPRYFMPLGQEINDQWDNKKWYN